MPRVKRVPHRRRGIRLGQRQERAEGPRIDRFHGFGKGGQRGPQVPVAVKDHAVAVENELVVAADLIYINERALMPRRMAPAQGEARTFSLSMWNGDAEMLMSRVAPWRASSLTGSLS